MKVTFELYTDAPADSAALAKLLSVLTSPDTYTNPATANAVTVVHEAPDSRVTVSYDSSLAPQPDVQVAVSPEAVNEVRAQSEQTTVSSPAVSVDDLKAAFTDFIKNKTIGGPANAKKLLQSFGAECLVGAGALDASKYAEVYAAIKAALAAVP